MAMKGCTAVVGGVCKYFSGGNVFISSYGRLRPVRIFSCCVYCCLRRSSFLRAKRKCCFGLNMKESAQIFVMCVSCANRMPHRSWHCCTVERVLSFGLCLDYTRSFSLFRHYLRDVTYVAPPTCDCKHTKITQPSFSCTSPALPAAMKKGCILHTPLYVRGVSIMG